MLNFVTKKCDELYSPPCRLYVENWSCNVTFYKIITGPINASDYFLHQKLYYFCSRL